jgi:hypothetical protein
MSGWTNSNIKRIMDYSVAADRKTRQERKNTGIIISKRVLFNEIRSTYQCYCGRRCYQMSSKSKEVREKSNELDSKGIVQTSSSDTSTLNHVF